MKLLFTIIIILTVIGTVTTETAKSQEENTRDLKSIPPAIESEVRAALHFFPELEDVPIEFEFKKKIKHTTMQAQPKLSSLFKRRDNRAYIIKIAQKVKIEGDVFYTKNLPRDVMIGWIGHELGHIMDYQEYSNLGMMWFGIRYVLSDNYISEAERAADVYAVEQGMADFIIKTKEFILNHANISEEYKMRVKKYYLSPEEILMLAKGENVEEIKESLANGS